MPSIITSLATVLIAMIFTVVTPQPAHAQRPAPMPRSQEITQVSLTEDMVNRFIGTMEGVQALSRKYKDQTPRTRFSRDPVAGFTGFLQAGQAREQMQSVLNSHGFSDIANWLDVARTIMITYGYVKSGKSLGRANQQMEQAIAQIQNNPKLSPQQKDMILKSFSSSMAQFRKFHPTPENFALIQRMLPLLQDKVDFFRKR